MAVPPPILNPSDLIETARRFRVLLGPSGGALPTAADEVDWLVPLSISTAIGTSQRLNTISLKVDLRKANRRLVDVQVPVAHNQLVSVCTLDENAELHQVAWGRVATQQANLSARMEGVQLTVRLDDDLIGSNRVTGYKQLQPPGLIAQTLATPRIVNVDGAIVFNPRVNGRTVGNCAKFELTFAGITTSFWLDSDATLVTHSNEPTRWTLARAVHAMCWLLNPAETYITNPLLLELDAILIDPAISPERMLRNVVIDVGASLRESLNQLLRPLRFGWRIDHDDQPGQKSHLRFFRLRKGIGVSLNIVRPGERLTRTSNNLDSLSQTISIADLANDVSGHGSWIDYEDSWELFAGWLPALDSNPDFKPHKVQADTDIDQHANGDVWRLFVLNESGQYTDLGRENMPTPVSTANKLLSLDGERSAIRRRRFRPCLTQSLADEGHKLGDRGYVLEVRDENDLTQWKRVNWDFEILTDECSIRLRRPQAETQFVLDNPDSTDGQRSVLRITAVIRADFCPWGKAPRRPNVSPQGADIKVILNLSSQFHFRRVRATSLLYSRRHEAIVDVVRTTRTITVASVLPDEVDVGETIVILDSDDNDGGYTIESIFALNGQSVITTVEAISGLSSNGVLAYRTEEASDVQRLQRHVERVRDTDDVAEISASLSVDRFDPSYQIGHVVEKINGRNISLNAATSQSTTPQFVTIVGINYSLSGEQHTEILTETFKGENYDDGEL